MMSWLKNRLLSLVMLSVVAVLFGCQGDNNNRRAAITVYGDVQFYNAAVGSPKVQFQVPDITYAGAVATTTWEAVTGYGKVSQRKTISPGDYTLHINRRNPQTGEYDLAIASQPLTVVDDVHQFVVLTGDFSAPELKVFTFADNTARAALNFDFRAYNFTSGYAQLEILYGPEGGSLQDAQLHATISNGAESVFEELEEGRYVFYVVDADTSELLLTTDVIPFVRNTAYFLIVRDDLISGGIQLDQINRSAVAYSYGEPQTQGQFRLYQSLEDLGAVDVTLSGDQGEYTIVNVAADQFTPALVMEAGSYTVDISQVGGGTTYVDALPLNILGGRVLDVAMLRTEIVDANSVITEVVGSIDYRPETIANDYESSVDVINLALFKNSEGVAQSLRLYFVPADSYTGNPETDKAAAVAPKITGLRQGDVIPVVLPVHDYYVYVAYKSGETTVTENEVTTVIDVETDIVDGQSVNLISGENYQLIFEPDSTQSSGYRLTLH